MVIEANLLCQVTKKQIIKEGINVEVCSSFVPQNIFYVTYGYIEDIEGQKHFEKNYYKVQNIINAEYYYENTLFSLLLLQIVVDGKIITYVYNKDNQNSNYVIESDIPFDLNFNFLGKELLIDIDILTKKEEISNILSYIK